MYVYICVCAYVCVFVCLVNTYRICILTGPSRKTKTGKGVVPMYFDKEEEEEDNERAAIIDTGMFSVKVRMCVCY